MEYYTNIEQFGRNNNTDYSQPPSSPPPYGFPYPPSYQMPGKSLATGAMILGIISILFTFLLPIYIPMILGSIAIVLAILSKGTKKNMPGQATAGLVCGAGSLVVNVCMLTVSMVFWHWIHVPVHGNVRQKRKPEEKYGWPI